MTGSDRDPTRSTFANDDSGALRRDLQLGVVTRVTAEQVEMNFITASAPSGAFVERQRHGRGEIGEIVLIEGQRRLVLARVTGLRVPESERHVIGRPGQRDVIGTLQLLGSVDPFTLEVEAGIETHPRVGDIVYAAPHSFVAQISSRLIGDSGATMLDIGHVHGSPVALSAEALVARHCAIVGATGGGKSWTVARLVEQLAEHSEAKVLLLDATGEYRSLRDDRVMHCHFGTPPHREVAGSAQVSFSHELFEEHDFFALFQPSGKAQAPKLREAIRTLRLAKLAGLEAPYVKTQRERAHFDGLREDHAEAIEDPRCSFDVHCLAEQLLHECVWDDPGRWGKVNDNEKTACVYLATRIRGIVGSRSFAPVFSPGNAQSFATTFGGFLDDRNRRVLRLDLSGLSYEHSARVLIVNALARMLLTGARGRRADGTTPISISRPLLLIVDEAHQFLGKTLGAEDAQYRLDAVELIAREGRKYGLCVCLATQRPRDVTEGVLAQMGCFIVHRIVNDHDRFVIERASGDIDREAAAFLPSLRQGRAVVVGVDFPIPLTVQIAQPVHRPASDSAKFKRAKPPSVPTADSTASARTAPTTAPQAAAPPQASAPQTRRRRRVPSEPPEAE